jgi:hypothetical protein
MNVRFFICALVFCLLSSCANFGPRQLPSNRLRYNYSLENSDIQQRLLNIVRLRYSDAPYFLNVSSIVSQFTYSGNLGAGLANNILTARAKSPIWQATGGGVLTEAPTITYTPLQGKKYVSMLLTPIDLTVIYMMIREGWAIDRIFRLLLQKFGPLDNGMHAYGTILTSIPHYDEFRKFSNVLRVLQYNNLIETDDETINKKPAIKFTVLNFNTLNTAQRKILARVNLTPSTPTIWLVAFSSTNKQYINIQTRTVLSVFNYLSKAVDVPQEHVSNQSAAQVRMNNGQMHDWTSAIQGMLRIYVAEHKPTGAAVAIRYRKHWFYIKDNDFDSKQTLDLLTLIVNIYEGSPSSSAPVFTIS